MCGITGWISLRTPVQAEVLGRMRDTLVHRGPDDADLWCSPQGHAGLGHRRLTFLDLGQTGRQPMCNEDGSLWLVFNGEIYNYLELRAELQRQGHIFRSQSDSEVLLHGYEAWGPQLLDRLKGMFAFALWDEHRRQLFLARDRFGIKPLYYAHTGGHFLFGSELKAILAHPQVPRRINRKAVLDYLVYRYVPSPNTIWEDLHKLPPAHWLLYDAATEKTTVRRYWSIPDRPVQWAEKEAVERVDALLLQSVTEHLRADVPIGAFLSGGYDSSALVYYQTRLGQRPHTFSIGFHDWPESEHHYARQVADHLGVTNQHVLVGDEQLPLLETLMYHYDEPLGDISILPTYLVSQLAAADRKAVLSGEGADELFGGYSWQQSVAKVPAWRYWMQTDRRGWLTARYAEAMSMGRFEKDTFSRYLGPDWTAAVRKDPEWFYRENARPDLPALKAVQHLDTRAFMGELVLTKIDRASMAHSLETRVPFLDHELFEAVMALRKNSFFRPEQTKFLLYKNLVGHLPESILQRKKQGFVGPDRYYMNFPWYERTLRGGALIQAGVLRPAGLELLLAEKDHWRLWKFAVLEFWWRRWA
jgi:asparagine synthase (glutamine-hydrolysing)